MAGGLSLSTQGFLDMVFTFLGKTVGWFVSGGIYVNLAASFPEQSQLITKAGAVAAHQKVYFDPVYSAV